MGRVGQAITFDTCFVTLMKACRQAHTCVTLFKPSLEALVQDLLTYLVSRRKKKTCLLRVLVSEHMRTTFCKLSHGMSKQQ